MEQAHLGRPSYARFCALDIINQKNVENSLSDHHAIMDLIDTHNILDVQKLLEHHSTAD